MNRIEVNLGWRTSNVNRVAVGGTNLKTQYPKDVWCNRYHDNDSVIYREFEKIGEQSVLIDLKAEQKPEKRKIGHQSKIVTTSFAMGVMIFLEL